MRFFVDENLDGPAFVDPLRAAGLDVTRHRDLFAQGVPDTEWLPIVAARALVVLTSDGRMQFRPVEVEAIIGSRALVGLGRPGRVEAGQGLRPKRLRAPGERREAQPPTMTLTIDRPHTVDPDLAVAALTYIAERQTRPMLPSVFRVLVDAEKRHLTEYLQSKCWRRAISTPSAKAPSNAWTQRSSRSGA